MRDHVELYINGEPVRVEGDDAFLTLSDYLRQRRQLVGTKVVCAEGDCGACSVLVGRASEGGIRYAPVTSCILLMYQLDAAHVVTIEGLKDAGHLSPLQSSMVACQGTQCGFCTPGFVVVGHHLLAGGTRDATGITRGLVGNLCRCTGYDSIVRAMLATDCNSLKPLDTLYPPSPIASALTALAAESVRVVTSSHVCFKPTTLAEAVQLRSEHPEAMIVSGASDIGVLVNKRTLDPTSVLCLSGIAGFDAIDTDATTIRVGGGATLANLECVCEQSLPVLAEFLQWFGSPLIKNAGTLAGNLATASPIGDMTPPLIALDAEIELMSIAGTRRVAMSDFITGYRKTVLRPDEIISSIRIPIPSSDWSIRFYKVAKRKDLDISTVSAAIVMHLANGSVDDVRIVMGGVGPTALRLVNTEQLLRGQSPSLDLFVHAADAARSEVSPITDVRGSEEYRRAVAGNQLLKFFHDAVGQPEGVA